MVNATKSASAFAACSCQENLGTDELEDSASGLVDLARGPSFKFTKRCRFKATCSGTLKPCPRFAGAPPESAMSATLQTGGSLCRSCLCHVLHGTGVPPTQALRIRGSSFVNILCEHPLFQKAIVGGLPLEASRRGRPEPYRRSVVLGGLQELQATRGKSQNAMPFTFSGAHQEPTNYSQIGRVKCVSTVVLPGSSLQT